MTHPSWMEVDLEALAYNHAEVRRLVGPDTHIIASVKGNGYGVGIVESARVLDFLGVYAVAMGAFEDAVAIREAGIGVKIHMFPGNLPEAIPDLLRYDLIPTICNMETASAVSKAASAPAAVFIKVDSGLARLGVPLDDAEAFIRAVAALPNVVVEGVFTHLPYSDADGQTWSLERSKQFEDMVGRLEDSGMKIPITQSLASAAVVCQAPTRCNAVCVGHLLFGGLTRVTPDLADLGSFRPVLAAVKSSLIHIGHHSADKWIAGGKRLLKAGSITGVVPFGLYDGYHQPRSDGEAAMLVRGMRAPVIGVSQEYTTIDLTKVDAPRLGDEVVIIGENGGDCISIEEMATTLGWSPLNVLMSLSGRLPAIYHGRGEPVHASEIG